MVILLFFAGAVLLLAVIALLINVIVRRRGLTRPRSPQDGLGDDLRLGMGLNLWS